MKCSTLKQKDQGRDSGSEAASLPLKVTLCTQSEQYSVVQRLNDEHKSQALLGTMPFLKIIASLKKKNVLAVS